MIYSWLLLLLIIVQNPIHACRCEKCIKNIPEEIQVLQLEKCTEYTHFEPILGNLKNASDPQFEILLREHVKKYNNVAGSKFTFADGTQKEIYRSGYLGESPEALQELVKSREVETILNIHNTTKFNLEPWIEKEKKLFFGLGGQEYIYIGDFNYNFENEEQEMKVFEKIASIISIIRNCKGNVLFHCMGGEHRSGIMYAILHKCYHQIPMESIIQEYKCHAAWESESQPGGYNPKNVELIYDFPTTLAQP